MRLEVETPTVTVRFAFEIADRDEWNVAELTYNVESYKITATADTSDQLRALMAAAEPDGSDIRKVVEDVIKRTEALRDEWYAAMKGTAE